MKIKHIYIVTREFDVPEEEVQKEIDYFRAISDESGEYLYGGCCMEEEIEVKFEVDGKPHEYQAKNLE